MTGVKLADAALIALPAAANPPKGYKWVITGAHVELNPTGAQASTRAVAYLAQDNAGPHGQIIADTGAFAAAGAGAILGEGGVSATCFFSAGLLESLYTQWSGRMCVSQNQSIVFVSVGVVVSATNTFKYRISMEEVVDEGADF